MLTMPAPTTFFEQKVLELLESRAGEFVSRREIEVHLYGYSTIRENSSNSVQVFILRLRRKGFAINTKRGSGYGVQTK